MPIKPFKRALSLAACAAALALAASPAWAIMVQTNQVTVTATVTRPANVTAYAANQALADSTTAPTVGGFALTGSAAHQAGSGVISDLVVVDSNDPATLLQGELWIFDSAVAAVNDGASFSLSDADAVKLVAVVPFTLASTMAGSGNNSYAHVQNLAIGFTTAGGAADLRFLVKVKGAYTPASGEALTVRAKILQVN